MDIRELHIVEEAISDMLKDQLFKDFEIDECMNFVRTRVYGKIKITPTDYSIEIPFPTALNPLSTTQARVRLGYFNHDEFYGNLVILFNVDDNTTYRLSNSSYVPPCVFPDDDYMYDYFLEFLIQFEVVGPKGGQKGSQVG